MSNHADDLLAAMPSSIELNKELIEQLSNTFRDMHAINHARLVEDRTELVEGEFTAYVTLENRAMYLLRGILAEFNRNLDKTSILVSSLHKIIFEDSHLNEGKEKISKLIALGYPVELTPFKSEGVMVGNFHVIQFSESVEVNGVPYVKGQYPLLLDPDDINCIFPLAVE